MQQKPLLNSRWSVKPGLLRHSHAKSTLSFSSNSKWKPFSKQSQHTGSTNLKQGTCVLYCSSTFHMNGSVHAKSGSCWSSSAGTRSPQSLFCTKSSMHGISVINNRWSLSTKFVNSSFTVFIQC